MQSNFPPAARFCVCACVLTLGCASRGSGVAKRLHQMISPFWDMAKLYVREFSFCCHGFIKCITLLLMSRSLNGTERYQTLQIYRLITSSTRQATGPITTRCAKLSCQALWLLHHPQCMALALYMIWNVIPASHPTCFRPTAIKFPIRVVVVAAWTLE